jgi:hypothetical protein
MSETQQDDHPQLPVPAAYRAAHRASAGIALYDATGAWLGTLRELDPQHHYAVMEKGGHFPHDLYVPLEAVSRAEASAWYLAVRCEQIARQRWEQPPGHHDE